MKPTIGIPGTRENQTSFFGASENYLNWISSFGNPRIIMPWEEFVEVDLLVIPGGLDIAPSNYGEIPGFSTTNTDVFKEFFFQKRLKNYVDNNTSIFGICLGMQQLAVYFGCKLKQNMLYHEQSPGRWQEAHPLYIYNGEETKEIKQKVNSHHHQCLMYNEAEKNEHIQPIHLAFNEDGAHVESFSVKDKNIFAVQWHPEELYDTTSKKFIEILLK